MGVNIIVAVGNLDESKNLYPIGRNGTMPWHNKKDLKWFKDMTTNNVVIMGRKTYNAIGHPLPNRINIIVSTSIEKDSIKECIVCQNLEEAIQIAKDSCGNNKVFIIGGGRLYFEALNKGLVDCVYMDMIEEDVTDADTFFPNLFELNDWVISEEKFEIDENKAYAVKFERKEDE